jgi:ribulose-5-phosphate 4-epimerase/fuculose-1-phosphate aldolase
MILRNHGTLAVGRSVAEAFQSIYFLARACAIQIAALTASDDLHEVTEPVHEVVRRQAASFGDIADRLLWPALLRKLDRFDTSYRD